jgi:outer membrane protein OmpA-like peptidoglycan-associated protein
MRTLTISLLFFFSLQSLAQNLIPNAGFESCNEIPNRWSGTFSKFNRWMKVWNSPTQGSPDILFTKLKDQMFPARPGFDLKPHFPHGGMIMLGIKTYGCQSGTLHCKEYLQIKLKEQLIVGDEYYVEFFVNPLQHSVLVNNIGVGFSTKKQRRIYDEGLYDIRPAVVDKEIKRSVPNQWEKVSGTFVADSTYQYLIIGNFFKDKVTLADASVAKIKYSFLFIDDVLLKNISGNQTSLRAEAMEVGDVIRLDNIQFDHNKAELLPASHTTLNELVEILQERPTIKLEIAGHTDNVGSAEFNLNLSERRAQAVYNYLVGKQIPAERLTFKGYGETIPIADNDSESGRQENRRVELKVLEQ